MKEKIVNIIEKVLSFFDGITKSGIMTIRNPEKYQDKEKKQ